MKLIELTCTINLIKSHPSWVCGLKHHHLVISLGTKSVTPFVGVWIETCYLLLCAMCVSSHPSWVCGLKLKMHFIRNFKIRSHPSWVCGLKPQNHADNLSRCESHPSWVCGLKLTRLSDLKISQKSHPSWVCGLKRFCDYGTYKQVRHTLRGCVD